MNKLTYLRWEAVKDAVWDRITARVAASVDTPKRETIEGIFKAAGIPPTTGYEMFNPEPRRVKFENVMRLLSVIGLGPAWLAEFLPKPVESVPVKSNPKKRKRATAKAR